MNFTKKEYIRKILNILEETLSTKKPTGLKHWKHDWQFLFAVILSAQTNDDQVNQVTPHLFKEFPTIKSFTKAKLQRIQHTIESIGLYRNKAAFLKQSAQMLLENYHGDVPQSLQELITLPGVGRKTANVFQGVILQKSEGIAVDTHVARVSRRLQLTNNTKADKVEKDLKKIVPKNKYHRINPLFFWHGREVCIARKPQCEECVLAGICPFNSNNT